MAFSKWQVVPYGQLAHLDLWVQLWASWVVLGVMSSVQSVPAHVGCRVMR